MLHSDTPPIDDAAVLQSLQRTMQCEAAAIARLADQIDAQVVQAVHTLWRCQGRVIVSGMGKMSSIARKAAATLCSTGTPAVFLHPSEAQHGDLGIVTPQDVFLALTYSGETDELNALLPFLQRQQVPIVAVTGKPDSQLARRASVVIDVHVEREADPISLAPTCSTTVCLAMCDALAVALMELRGFTKDQLAIFHPGGNLGRKLLLTVGDLMHSGERVPQVNEGESLQQAVLEISRGGLGAVFVLNADGQLQGVFTDGDLRRTLQSGPGAQSEPAASCWTKPIDDFMTRQPQSITAEELAAAALQRMEAKAITVLPVIDERSRPIGALHLHDVIRAGLA